MELVHPLWHMTHFRKYWVYLMILFSWILGCGYTLSVTVIINKVCGENIFVNNLMLKYDFNLIAFFFVFQAVGEICVRYVWPNEMSQKVMGFVQLVIEFFMPLVVLILCYSSIIYTLSKKINTDQLSSGQEVNLAANRLQLAKRNTLITFTIVAGAYVLCWSQNQVLFLMYNLGFSVDFDGTYHDFTVLMTFLNCTINPFIYLLKYKDYKMALKDFIVCSGQNDRGPGDSFSTQSTAVSTTQQLWSVHVQ